MAERQVELFREPFIAIYRPNKKTYTILGWVPVGRYWKRHQTTPEAIQATTIREQNIPPTLANINVIAFNDELHRRVVCTATGEYLAYENYSIAILRKRTSSPGSFPTTIFAFEFPCTARSEPPETIPPLWTLRMEPVLPQQEIIPLPMRIAWILAEYASRQGETCSITLEQISPVTASVTTCFHVFDTTALDTWFQTNTSCPLCKQKTLSTRAMVSIEELPIHAPVDLPMDLPIEEE